MMILKSISNLFIVIKYMNIYLTLLSPLLELFPELGGSYFLPPNLNKEFYDRMILPKTLCMVLVWFVITKQIYSINKLFFPYFWILVGLSFITRLFANQHVSKLSPIFYTIMFAILLYILILQCKDNSCKYENIFIIISLFIGAMVMSYSRQYQIKNTDILGRITFSLSFVLFILNLFNATQNTAISMLLILSIIITIMLII